MSAWYLMRLEGMISKRHDVTRVATVESYHFSWDNSQKIDIGKGRIFKIPQTHEISATHQIITNPLVVVFLVVIHPDFGESDWVLLKNVNSRSPLVGRTTSEDVSDVGTWNNFQSSSTHPGLSAGKIIQAQKTRKIMLGCLITDWQTVVSVCEREGKKWWRIIMMNCRVTLGYDTTVVRTFSNLERSTFLFSIWVLYFFRWNVSVCVWLTGTFSPSLSLSGRGVLKPLLSHTVSVTSRLELTSKGTGTERRKNLSMPFYLG